MLLPPRRPEPYTAESYVEDLVDGRIGWGRFSRSGHQFNFKIEFERLTPAEQEAVIALLAESPDALEKLERLMQSCEDMPPGSDSLQLAAFAERLADKILEDNSDASKSAPVVPLSRSVSAFTTTDPSRDCFSDFVDADPDFYDACESAFVAYKSLPVVSHADVFVSNPDASPRTADVCGHTAFNDLFFASLPGSSADIARVTRDYQRCEANLAVRLQAAEEVRDLQYAIFQALPDEAQAGRRPDAIPVSALRALVEQYGYTAWDLLSVRLLTETITPQDEFRVSLSLQKENGEATTMLLGVRTFATVPTADDDAATAAWRQARQETCQRVQLLQGFACLTE